MDALFLKVISSNPQQAPKLFLSLYGGVPTKRLIRFMSDQASLADRIAVMASLPVKPFLSTLIK
jgi:lycopene beta-cyclase